MFYLGLIGVKFCQIWSFVRFGFCFFRVFVLDDKVDVENIKVNNIKWYLLRVS